MLLFPHWTQNRISEHLGKTPSWVSTIINSDVFNAYYVKRMSEHHEGITEGITDRIEGIATLSLDVIKAKLKKAREGLDIPLPQLNETSEMALKALGYGGKGANGQANHNSLHVSIGAVGNLTLEAALTQLDDAKKAQPPKETSEQPAAPIKIINGEVKKVEERQLTIPFE